VRIEEWNQVHDIVVASTGALLTSVGLQSFYVGTVPHRAAAWAETLAIIGLTGKLRGSLVLSVPPSLVKRSHPCGATDPDDLGDWLAEMANLLLGRIKSSLLTQGATIQASTPLTLSATAFRFERFQGTPVVHEFDLDGQTLLTVFEAIADPDLRLTPPRVGVVLAPGDMISF
jgi:hypothetical protein